MTGTERFQALMTGRVPDRVPVVCNLLDQGARELGLKLEDYYARGEHVARGRLLSRQKYGYDTVVATFYAAMEAELLGCRNIVYAEEGPPNVGDLVIRTPDDIDKLQVPTDLRAHPRFREQAECIRILKRELNGEYPVVAVAVSSFSLPAILMGISGWLELLTCGTPASRKVLLEKCAQFCRLHITALREAGADLIIYTDSVATADVITRKQFQELALPAIQRDLDGLGTADVVYFNGGGRINPHLETLMGQTSLRAFYINPFDDVAEAKRILGGRALLVAAINDIRLIDWTVDGINTEVRRIMESGKADGGFLFGTLMMPFAIPDSNIHAMIEAAHRYGSYAG
ncbi:MAG TPA: uroporphyrinogen decarboxylase family protein [Vicinamibacterales bacterium]|jgi:uroporphyrinogen decarboxylase